MITPFGLNVSIHEWSVDDGMRPGTVVALAQTPDGYL